MKVPRRELWMQEAKTYRQYAADCRRIAQTMNAKDKAVMLEMARVWDERAADADKAHAMRQIHTLLDGVLDDAAWKNAAPKPVASPRG